MKTYLYLMILISIGFVGVNFVLRSSVRSAFGVDTWMLVAASLFVGMVLQSPAYMLLIAAIGVLATRTRLAAVTRACVLLPLLPFVPWNLAIASLWLTTLNMPAVLMLAAAVAVATRGGFTRRRWGGADWAIAVVIVILTFGEFREYFSSGMPRTALNVIMFIGVPYYVLSRGVFGLEEMRRVVAAVGAAALILSVVSLFESVMLWSIYETAHFSIEGGLQARQAKVRSGLMRSPTSFVESTAFAFFMMTTTFALIFSRWAFRSRLLWMASVALAGLGLLAAQSRGALLGLIAGLTASFLVRRKGAGAVLILLLSSTSVTILFILANSSPRIASFLGLDSGGYAGYTDYRELLLERGLEEGLSRPFFGDSIVNVLSRLRDIIQGEGIVDLVNSYLYLFLVSGIFGLIAFSVTMYATLSAIWRRSPEQAQDQDFVELQTFLAAALVAQLLALTVTSFQSNVIWLVFVLGAVASLHTARRSVTVAIRNA